MYRAENSMYIFYLQSACHILSINVLAHFTVGFISVIKKMTCLGERNEVEYLVINIVQMMPRFSYKLTSCLFVCCCFFNYLISLQWYRIGTYNVSKTALALLDQK